MEERNKKEPRLNRAQQIKNALTRKHYRDDDVDGRLKDAQVYTWLSICIVCISLVIFLTQITRCLL